MGQSINRPTKPAEACEAIDLMHQAVAAAGADSGAASLLGRAELVIAVAGVWRYPDPAKLVADRVGAVDAATLLTYFGGNSPQAAVAAAAGQIAAGEADVVIVCGAEAQYSKRIVRAGGAEPSYSFPADQVMADRFGDDLDMAFEPERTRGVDAPISVYPVFGSAIRHERGETIDEQRDAIAALWEGYNIVARTNPYAWSPAAMSATEIREPSASNRMVGFPYTKAMNANGTVDQGAAVILCSTAVAEELAIDRELWVFPQSACSANDPKRVAARPSLSRSAAIRMAGNRALTLAETKIDEVSHLDLYSCFPSIVRMTTAELGIDPDRRLTQTGGLSFAGAPLNNCVTHSIAAMVATLRNDPGSLGFVQGNGGYATKQAFGVYSSAAPADGFRLADVQSEVDTVASTSVGRGDYSGTVTVEGYTVLHQRDGSARLIAALRTVDDERVWGVSDDGDLVAEAQAQEFIGKTGSITKDGVLSL